MAVTDKATAPLGPAAHRRNCSMISRPPAPPNGMGRARNNQSSDAAKQKVERATKQFERAKRALAEAENCAAERHRKAVEQWEAAVEKATADAQQYRNREHFARQQANDASREIARSERKRAESAVEELLAARRLLQEKTAAGEAARQARDNSKQAAEAVDFFVRYYEQPAGGAPFSARPPVPQDPLVPDVRFVDGNVQRESIEGRQLSQLRRWWLKRMVKSPRPLQEKLALFWHGHFATQNSTVGNSYTMYKQNQLFREHAAGNFGIEQVSDTAMLDGAIQQMGQQLFEPLDVKGWRRGRAWISAKRMFARYNAMGELIRQVAQPAGRGIDLVRFLEQSDAGSTEQVVDYLAQACLATPLNTESRQKLIQFVDPLPPRSSWDQRREELNQRLRTVVILMMSLPEHQMS